MSLVCKKFCFYTLSLSGLDSLVLCWLISCLLAVKHDLPYYCCSHMYVSLVVPGNVLDYKFLKNMSPHFSESLCVLILSVIVTTIPIRFIILWILNEQQRKCELWRFCISVSLNILIWSRHIHSCDQTFCCSQPNMIQSVIIACDYF